MDTSDRILDETCIIIGRRAQGDSDSEPEPHLYSRSILTDSSRALSSVSGLEILLLENRRRPRRCRKGVAV